MRILRRLLNLRNRPQGYLRFRLGVHLRRQGRDRIARLRDRATPTFSPEGLERPISYIVRAPARHELEGDAEILRTTSEAIVGHRVQVLGLPELPLKHVQFEPGALQEEARVECSSLRLTLEEAVPRLALGRARALREHLDSDYRAIDWHRDFRSGFRWDSRDWYRDVRLVGNLGADIKIPWELGRLQHHVCLALAFGLDKNPVMPKEYQNQLVDFVSTCVPRFGLHWACTMEVAIRAANLAVAHDLFRQYGASFEPWFEELVATTLWEHCQHVVGNLEWHPRFRNNHYLANLAGLAFVGRALRDACEDARGWSELALEELAREVPVHFLPDGGSAEGSTRYHLLSLEIILATLSLDRASSPGPEEARRERGREALGGSTECRERLENAVRFAIALSSRKGKAFRIGDNDSGRFLGLVIHRDSKAAKTVAPVWNRGHASVEVVESLAQGLGLAGERDPSQDSSHSFPEFGVNVARRGPWAITLRGRPRHAPLLKFHGHPDALSLCVFLRDHELIVDPGRYSYAGWAPEGVAPERRAAHALPFLGEGPCEPSLWYSVPNEGDKLTDWDADIHKVLSQASCALGDTVVARSVGLTAESVLVSDARSSAGGLRIRVPLGPGVVARALGSEVIGDCFGSRFRFSFGTSRVKMVDSYSCVEYGRHDRSSVVEVSSENPRLDWLVTWED